MHQVPAPTGDFVGRAAEIEQLVNGLNPAQEGSAASICGIRGMGGVGKTQLAYVVTHLVMPIFPDAQILLDLRGSRPDPLAPEQALKTIIEAFEPEALLPDDSHGLRSTFLSLCHDKRVLIIADDARDADQVGPLIPPRGSALLITSRNRFSLPGMMSVSLEILNHEDAMRLLLAISPRIGLEASGLAQLCGCLPLALRLSANLIETGTRGVQWYTEALRDRRERLRLLRDPDDPTIGVEAALQLSYDALDENARQLLCQIGVFPATFDRKAVQEVATLVVREAEPSSTELVEEALDLLFRRSLIQFDRETERFSLHDLVRDFALEHLEDDASIRLRHASYYAKVANDADNLYMRGGEAQNAGLSLFDVERANIDAGWSWAQRTATSTPRPAIDIAGLLVSFALATAYIGNLRYDIRRERIPQLELALQVALGLAAEAKLLPPLGAAHTKTLRGLEAKLLGQLGVAYYLAGQATTAITYHEHSLRIVREIGDRDGESAALDSLGSAYTVLGDANTAITYHKQSLQITRKIGDQHDVSKALGNLGNAYAELGDTDKAIDCYEQQLDIVRKIGHRHSESIALGNLGTVYAKLGDTDKAIDCYEQHLQIARAIGDRHGVSRALGNLGSIHAELGHTDKAITCYEECLQIARAVGDLRLESMVCWELGSELARRGDLKRAVELMRVTVAFERETGDANAQEHADELEQAEAKLLHGQ